MKLDFPDLQLPLPQYSPVNERKKKQKQKKKCLGIFRENSSNSLLYGWHQADMVIHTFHGTSLELCLVYSNLMGKRKQEIINIIHLFTSTICRFLTSIKKERRKKLLYIQNHVRLHFYLFIFKNNL